MSGDNAENSRRTIRDDLHLWISSTLIITFFSAILIARIFYYDIFSIPATSMEPTVNIGDFAIISKGAYGSSDIAESKLPKRGEIFAFRSPHNKNTIFLKRIIG